MCVFRLDDVSRVTYESVLDVSGVDLGDELLEFGRILDEADAAVDVVLEPVDVRSQVASLSSHEHKPTSTSV